MVNFKGSDTFCNIPVRSDFELCMTTDAIAERPIGFGLLSFTGFPQGVLIDAPSRVEKESVGDELVKQWLD